MTDKQTKILKVALTLFAEKGYDATSTNKVAKTAGVSEGLIFRHFQNKEGLLNAIMQQGKSKIEVLYTNIFSLSNPKEILRAIIEIPFSIKESDYAYWKLLYALKWQADVYDASFSAPINERLQRAFRELNYANPEAEADTVLLLLDGVATSILLRKPKNKEALLTAILEKYDI